MGVCEIILLVIVAAILLDFIFLSAYCRIMPWLEKSQKEKNVKKMELKINEIDNIHGGKATSQDVVENTKNKQSKIKNFIWWLIFNYFYGIMRYSQICVSRFPSFAIRNLLYRLVFNMNITKKTVIYGDCEIRSPWNFNADNVVVANHCIIDARNGVFVANNVVFGGGVHIWTEEHEINDPYFSVTETHKAPVVIDEHAWICSDTTILPGVHVGKGAVLASRACATKDLEPFGVYGGIPAKKIEERNIDLRYNLSGKPTYYFY
nr:acyltransferase [uncultured Anaerostipes sp.]